MSEFQYIPSDEEILWYARPNKLFYCAPDIPTCLGGILTAVLTCVSTVLMNSEQTNWYVDEPGRSIIKALFPLLFGGVAIGMLVVAPVQRFLNYKDVLYAITSRGVYVKSPTNVQFLALADIDVIEIIEYTRNIGDLVIHSSKDEYVDEVILSSVTMRGVNNPWELREEIYGVLEALKRG